MSIYVDVKFFQEAESWIFYIHNTDKSHFILSFDGIPGMQGCRFEFFKLFVIMLMPVTASLRLSAQAFAPQTVTMVRYMILLLVLSSDMCLINVSYNKCSKCKYNNMSIS